MAEWHAARTLCLQEKAACHSNILAVVSFTNQKAHVISREDLYWLFQDMLTQPLAKRPWARVSVF